MKKLTITTPTTTTSTPATAATTTPTKKRLSRKTMIIGGSALAAALVLGGTGIAYAATDGFEGSDALTGADLDRAAAVASDEIGGGTVTSAERDDDGFDLELRGDDGRFYEVDLDSSFAVVSSSADDRVGDGPATRSDDDADDRVDDGATGTTGATGSSGDGGTDAAAGAGRVDPDDLQGDELATASEAAIAAAGGGTVTEAERSDDADHAFEVEVRLSDGTEVDVELDESFAVVRTQP